MWDLSSPTGIQRSLQAVEAWRLNHWAAREVHFGIFLIRSDFPRDELGRDKSQRGGSESRLSTDLGVKRLGFWFQLYLDSQSFL